MRCGFGQSHGEVEDHGGRLHEGCKGLHQDRECCPHGGSEEQAAQCDVDLSRAGIRGLGLAHLRAQLLNEEPQIAERRADHLEVVAGLAMQGGGASPGCPRLDEVCQGLDAEEEGRR